MATNHMNHYTLQLANVGDVEAVLCRRGEAVVLTRRYTTMDRDECHRVYKAGGIITEVRTFDCHANIYNAGGIITEVGGTFDCHTNIYNAGGIITEVGGTFDCHANIYKAGGIITEVHTCDCHANIYHASQLGTLITMLKLINISPSHGMLGLFLLKCFFYSIIPPFYLDLFDSNNPIF